MSKEVQKQVAEHTQTNRSETGKGAGRLAGRYRVQSAGTKQLKWPGREWMGMGQWVLQSSTSTILCKLHLKLTVLPPEYKEEVLTEDFKNLRGSCGGGFAAAAIGVPEVGPSFHVSANVDTVDGVSSVTLKKKTVDIEKLRMSCTDKYVSLCVYMLEMLQTRFHVWRYLYFLYFIHGFISIY